RPARIVNLRYVRHFLLAVELFFACHPAPQTWADQRATLAGGAQHWGELTGTDPGDLRFVVREADRTVDLAEVQRIIFPARVRLPRTTGPSRRLTLWGGETLTGEVAAFDGQRVQLAVSPANRWDLPARGLSGIHQTPGLATIVYEDFEKPPTIWK